MSEWISVEDRLPDEYVPVLICGKSQLDERKPHTEYHFGYLEGGEWLEYDRQMFGEKYTKQLLKNTCAYNFYFFKEGAPDHWMPLPEPPNGS
jgi:hypothetical protein